MQKEFAPTSCFLQLTASTHCRFLVASGATGIGFKLCFKFTGPRNRQRKARIESQNSGFVHQIQLLLSCNGGGWYKSTKMSWNSSGERAKSTINRQSLLVFSGLHWLVRLSRHHDIIFAFLLLAATSGCGVGQLPSTRQSYRLLKVASNYFFSCSWRRTSVHVWLCLFLSCDWTLPWKWTDNCKQAGFLHNRKNVHILRPNVFRPLGYELLRPCVKVSDHFCAFFHSSQSAVWLLVFFFCLFSSLAPWFVA